MVVFLKVILLFSSTHLSWTLEGENLCYKNVSESGESVLKKECCTSFMEKNNKCIECLPGFHGTNCNSTCPPGNYGSRCLKTCHCDDDTEYCHHVCGCVVQTPLPDNNRTDLNSSDPVPTQSLCLISLDITYALDTTATNGLGTTEMDPIRKDVLQFLLHIGLPGVIVVCLLFIGVIYCNYTFGKQEKKQEQSIRHGASYGGNVENRDDDIHNEVDHTYGDPLHLSEEESCYSTLTLRVNRGSLYTSNTAENTETVSMDDNPYGFTFNRRDEEKLLDKNTNNFNGRNDASGNEMIQGISEDSCYAHNSLLRHYSIRRFDLTPDDANVTATQIKDGRHYELARNDFDLELDREIQRY
ncbi:uncharacterized protein LOC125675065 [Ostrea edulis]|uniref:uncharacterized protein LOC125675065 n=1 Tax=Ostrea edulis TaxID=37623 RepID=UPI0024AFB8A8|nr:uncharacterized protein LOC125675065 [Ostrea edulis]